MKEIFKKIQKHPMYEISNLGNICSWKNGKHGKSKHPKMLKQFDNGIGYKCVRIDKKTYRINILVLNTFVCLKPNNKFVCRHKDSNKVNNNLSNLEWCTYEQNYLDRKKLGMGNEGSKHGMYKHGLYSECYLKHKIFDMPKLECPFKRKMINNRYVVINEINKNMEWVFEDDSVMAIEKLDGTNVSIVIQEGAVIEMYNRTERIPFINKQKQYITQGVLNAKKKGYLEFLGDGQHFGESIGLGVRNSYNLDHSIWIPFTTFSQKHLKYKSWGKYPKDFKTISEWFKELLPLYSSMLGNRHGYVEGIVFTHPDGRMAKLRCNMFSWYFEDRKVKHGN